MPILFGTKLVQFLSANFCVTTFEAELRIKNSDSLCLNQNSNSIYYTFCLNFTNNFISGFILTF